MADFTSTSSSKNVVESLMDAKTSDFIKFGCGVAASGAAIMVAGGFASRMGSRAADAVLDSTAGRVALLAAAGYIGYKIYKACSDEQAEPVAATAPAVAADKAADAALSGVGAIADVATIALI